MSTIFEKIIQGELPAEKLFENERVIVIKDINPQAPVHLLIIPKKCYKSIQYIPKEDLSILAEIGEVAQKMAKELEIEDCYRLLTNSGEDSGQTIFHLHFHLIGGRKLGAMA
ncbi:MAG: histidine triad nucleotide-binding protein [Simkaniaceae bacterium]|nr:histidine triad nucleotide-binding protein [Simkaniaceae bacterium]